MGGAQHLIQPAVRHAGGQEHRPAHGLAQDLGLGRTRVVAERIHLVEADQLGSAGQVGSVLGELAAHREIGSGDVCLGGVDQMDQDPAALDVAEKAIAQPGASCAPSIRPGMSAMVKLS